MAHKSIILCLLLAVIAGCNNTTYIDNEGAAPGVSVPGKVICYNTVAIIDPVLQNWRGKTVMDDGVLELDDGAERAKFSLLAIDGNNADLTDAGTVRAWAQIRNRTDQPIQIEVRTTFFNAQKGPLEPASPWKRIFLNRNSVEMYTETSLNMVDSVGFYYIEIRKGR